MAKMTQTEWTNAEQIKVDDQKFAIAREKIETAITSLRKAEKEFRSARGYWNGNVDPDYRCEYDFHTLIGRITDVLVIQQRFADDIEDQIADL